METQYLECHDLAKQSLILWLSGLPISSMRLGVRANESLRLGLPFGAQSLPSFWCDTGAISKPWFKIRTSKGHQLFPRIWRTWLKNILKSTL